VGNLSGFATRSSKPLRRLVFFCAWMFITATPVFASEPMAPIVGNGHTDEFEDADMLDRWNSLKAAAVLCWRNDLTCFSELETVVFPNPTVTMPQPPDAPKAGPAELAFDGMYAYPRDAWAFASLRLLVKKGTCDAGTWRLPQKQSQGQVARALLTQPEALMRIAETQITRATWPQDWEELEKRIRPAIDACAKGHK
jgi:hypothetical protein